MPQAVTIVEYRPLDSNEIEVLVLAERALWKEALEQTFKYDGVLLPPESVIVPEKGYFSGVFVLDLGDGFEQEMFFCIYDTYVFGAK